MPVLVHLSGIHFGAHRQDLAESLLADIASMGPDLVVISGDLTQGIAPRLAVHGKEVAVRNSRSQWVLYDTSDGGWATWRWRRERDMVTNGCT